MDDMGPRAAIATARLSRAAARLLLVAGLLAGCDAGESGNYPAEDLSFPAGDAAALTDLGACFTRITITADPPAQGGLAYAPARLTAVAERSGVGTPMWSVTTA